MAVEQLFHLHSDSTAQPSPSTFHSLPIPQHATIAHTPPLGQTSKSPGPRLPQRPTNLMLKTFSTQSLPMQTTIFNAMNTANFLDVRTSPPPPPHLSSTVMTSSVNSTKKTWSLSISPLTPGHGLVPCYRHSSPPPTIPPKKPGTPHTPTINITNLMPTSCTNTNAPHNHHAHLGSSHQPTSNGNKLPCQHGCRKFFGNSYTAPTPSLHTLQLLGLSISKTYTYSSLIFNANPHMFQLHPTVPAFDL